MRDGPRRFTQDFSCPALLRCRLAPLSPFRVRGSHPLRPDSPDGSATQADRRRAGPTTPGAATDDRPGLGWCAFARHYLRNHCYFLFLRVLRCFSSPGSPTGLTPVCRARGPAGFPIRTSAGHRAFAPHRGFSQLVTSFFASGSHRHPPCALSLFPCSFIRLLEALRPFSLDSLNSVSIASIGGEHSTTLAGGMSPLSLRVPNMSMTSLCLSVVPGRLELPTSTLSV